MNLDEYTALTTAAGYWVTEGFGQFEITGPDAHAFVNRVATADISHLPPGRFANALLLRDDATIIDRVTVYRFEDRVLLLVGAAQREAAWEHIVSRKRGNVRIRDVSDEVGMIAVRGPATTARVSPVLSPFPQEPGDVFAARLAGVDVFVARVMLDGPDGIDLYCRRRDRESLERAVSRAGVLSVDSDTWRLLRIEWGVAAVGIDIDPDDTPVEAGLEHLVAEGKGAPFPGETALAARRRTGAIKRLVGFRVIGDSLPPIAARVSVAGHVIDRVRSIVLSPRAGIIGTTAVPITADAPGTPLIIEAGTQTWNAEIARRPFVSRSVINVDVAEAVR